VLRGLANLGLLDPGRIGLDVMVGSSAGAINSGMLAAHADDLVAGVRALEDIWANLEASQVFRTDVRSLGGIGARWAWDLTFGGAFGGVTPKALLDTAPLRQLLEARVPWDRLDEVVRSGSLYALAISATDLYSGDGTIFLHAAPDAPSWTRRRWRIDRTEMRAHHLLASSAIPIFFPSVEIGGRHFGDGSVRNTTPLSPAINLGADRIIAVSVREPGPVEQETANRAAPTIAQIAGVLLDAVMLDAIEVDVEHSSRVNHSVVSCRTGIVDNPFREVEVLWLRPSQNLTAIAADLAHRIPAVVRYLMRGLGSEESVTELSSYLLFDTAFCERLIDIGRADVEAAKDEIEAFFAPNATAEPVQGSTG
jgi:NTE family protein